MNTAQVNKESGNAVFDTATICDKLNLGGPIVPKGRVSDITIAGGLKVFGDIVVTGSNVPTGPASGDLFGNFPNPEVVGINGTPITDTVPMDGWVLTFGPLTLVTFDATISTLSMPADTLTLDSTPVLVDGTFVIGMTLVHPSLSGTVKVLSLDSGTLGANGSVYTITSSGSGDGPRGTAIGPDFAPFSGNVKVWDPAPSGGGPPNGGAGGDLDGSYPNPTIKTTGVTAGMYGSANRSARVTVNSKGQVILADDVPLNALTPSDMVIGGDLTGTYQAPTIAKLQSTDVVISAPMNNQVLTYNSSLTRWVNAPLPSTGLGPVLNPMAAGITGTYPSISLNTQPLTPATYGLNMAGSPVVIPQITVNSKGIITAATNNPFITPGPSIIGQVPAWNGSVWVPSAISITGTASGDISGPYPGPIIVTGLNNVPINTLSPLSNGNFLKYNGSQWVPGVGTTPEGGASGDLGGTYPSPTVEGLKGIPFVGTPSNNQILVYKTAMGGQWVYETPSGGSPTGTASGDLTGTYPGPTVDGIRGVSVSAGSATPTTGEILVYTGTNWNAQSANSAAYTATTPANWNGAPPTTIGAAIDRCAALLKTLGAMTGP